MMGGERENLPALSDSIRLHKTEGGNSEQQHNDSSVSPGVFIRGGDHANSTSEQRQNSQVRFAHTLTETAEEDVSWDGWAEIENDPDIFTILVQEWGAKNVRVEEVLDVSGLPNHQPGNVLGLIFLSRYVVPTTDKSTIPELQQDGLQKIPWFANQISKFSCGTLSLMNILMNCKNSELTGALSKFKEDTEDLSAKERGISLDQHTKFRDDHNAFSTMLDRMIVDQMLKDDFQAAKNRSQASKRKRGRKGTKRRASKASEDENGNHFVAYVPTGGLVWKLDGMEATPRCVGRTVDGMGWLDVAATAIMMQIQEAIEANYEVSLMRVIRFEAGISEDEAKKHERQRKQEDWAPFIQHMLRLHAEKGDLGQLLGM